MCCVVAVCKVHVLSLWRMSSWIMPTRQETLVRKRRWWELLASCYQPSPRSSFLPTVLLSNNSSLLKTRYTNTHTRTQTHPFNGPLSGTPQVSRYKKGKTNPDFTDTRDSEWQWHQLGHMQVCILLQTEITSPAPHHSDFYRPDALPAAQPTASKHWKQC